MLYRRTTVQRVYRKDEWQGERLFVRWADIVNKFILNGIISSVLFFSIAAVVIERKKKEVKDSNNSIKSEWKTYTNGTVSEKARAVE